MKIRSSINPVLAAVALAGLGSAAASAAKYSALPVNQELLIGDVLFCATNENVTAEITKNGNFLTRKNGEIVWQTGPQKVPVHEGMGDEVVFYVVMRGKGQLVMNAKGWFRKPYTDEDVPKTVTVWTPKGFKPYVEHSSLTLDANANLIIKTPGNVVVWQSDWPNSGMIKAR